MTTIRSPPIVTPCAEINNRIFLLKFTADELIRFGNGRDNFNGLHRFKNIFGEDGVFPNDADDRDFLPMRHVRGKAKFLDLLRNRLDLGLLRHWVWSVRIIEPKPPSKRAETSDFPWAIRR